MKRVSILMSLGLFVLASLNSGAASAHGGGAASLIAQPDAVRHGMTYSEWEAAYQLWFEEIPYAKNPQVHSDSPRNCELQPGNTVFAGPNGADCHIPSGSWIGLSTNYWECSTAEGLGDTFRQLRRCAVNNFTRFYNHHALPTTMTIDGARVRHQLRWTFTTPGEIIDFPAHNLWGADPGPSKSVTEGTMYLLRPLSDGTHYIRFHVNSDVYGTFNIDWTLHVG